MRSVKLAALQKVPAPHRLPAMRLSVLLLALAAFGCAGETPKDKTANDEKSAGGGNQPAPAHADRSRCDATGKKVIELDVNKDGKADVWKIMASQVDQGVKVDVLACKESDVNFDGNKDMWQYYDASGNLTLEEFDLDFDGKIDLWTYYQQGKKVRQEASTGFNGKPDIWKFFENDKIARIERSSQKNGKIDVWEYYEGGRLDRIGYDTTGSGKVDKWDRAPEEPEQPAAAPAPAPAPGAAAPAAQSAKPTSPTPAKISDEK